MFGDSMPKGRINKKLIKSTKKIQLHLFFIIDKTKIILFRHFSLCTISASLVIFSRFLKFDTDQYTFTCFLKRYKVSLVVFFIIIFQQSAIVLTVIDVNFLSGKDLLEYLRNHILGFSTQFSADYGKQLAHKDYEENPTPTNKILNFDFKMFSSFGRNVLNLSF